MCQTTGERLPAAWIISRIRIAAAAPLVLVRRGEGSGSALVCVCVCVSLAKTRDLIANHPLKEIALYGSPFGTFFFSAFLLWAWEGSRSLAPPFIQSRSSGRHLTKRADKQTAFIVSYSWEIFLIGVAHGLLKDGGATKSTNSGRITRLSFLCETAAC